MKKLFILIALLALPLNVWATDDSAATYPTSLDATGGTGCTSADCFDAEDGEVIYDTRYDTLADIAIKLETKLGYTASTGTRNIAIQGLFRYIDPAGAEAAALVAAGYVKTAWGSVIVTNAGQYSTSIFKGYPDAYYASGVPPRYLLPLSSETISKSNGLISNGYGFAQE